MKKELMVFLLLLPLALAAQDNLYQYDTLDIGLEVQSGFELVATGSGARAEEVTVNVLLVPMESYRQEILDIDHEGQAGNNNILFVWNNPAMGPHQFKYDAKIKTNNQRVEVRQKIPFPLAPQDIAGFEGYLQPTATIDSNHPQIIAKATELVEGEDDLFKAVFTLANWVDDNVDYDLTTLTAGTSQKASWVLENREGVCDEMTSLFVAMARSVGIPARFVSGISYTTSDLFSEPWQPHGWAEVYFPEVGWVDFDITFGEYGYIDVTHVKLRDGFDPQEAATRYEWLAHNVDLKTRELHINPQITDRGSIIPEELELEQEILAPEVDFGSYNVVKGIIKNTADYYAATTLRLAVPSEVEIIGKDRRTILLAPHEVKETAWVIKIRESLDEDYIYTFPTLIWSEKNTSVADSFKAQAGKPSYSAAEIEEFNGDIEERTYSRKVSLSCDFPPQVHVDEDTQVTCTIKNTGNTNLEQLHFCIERACETIDLPINQRYSQSVTIESQTVGWNKIIVSAENEVVQKTSSLEYVVVDEPKIIVGIESPETVQYADTFVLAMQLKKESFSNPRNVELEVRSPAGENVWEIEELLKDQNITLEMDSAGMSAKNMLEITVSWQDQEGKIYTETQEIMIRVIPTTIGDRIKMWINAVVNFVS
ncbi:MAG TPA: transglutaminase-like domain-containing protein [Candidatus Nanoarchaeia archaeon]|nr:transglutaminase-like domain-containing protein [Candidatus Nanoarchaeia archaeon]